MKHALFALGTIVLLAAAGCQTLPTECGGCDAGPKACDTGCAAAKTAPCASCRGGGAQFAGDGSGGYLDGAFGRMARMHRGHGGHHGGYDAGAGPAGPPTAAVAYPYYTIRGPRDFLVDKPPSLGN